jgi:hypothetical protein
MTEDFTNWKKDLTPTQWVMYGNAFATEVYYQAFNEPSAAVANFETWLKDTYEREKGNDNAN